MDLNIIRQKLAWAQYLSDITMTELGSEIGINNAAVSQTLAGKYKMTARFLITACTCLDIRVGWVAGESPAENELETMVQEKIEDGAKLTLEMKRSKAGKKPKNQRKKKKNTNIIMLEKYSKEQNFHNRLPELQSKVQNCLREYPEKNNSWIANRCDVLSRFVALERKAMKLSRLIRGI